MLLSIMYNCELTYMDEGASCAKSTNISAWSEAATLTILVAGRSPFINEDKQNDTDRIQMFSRDLQPSRNDNADYIINYVAK